MSRLWIACAFALATYAANAAESSAFPSRPVRFVSPFAAGGGTDILARAIARKLAEKWHQQVVVDNRPGATGIIGTEIVVKAPPDGYTMLLGNSATQAVNVSMFPKLSYHPLRDLACVTVVARLPEILVVQPSLSANSVAELIKHAQGQPGRLTFGSAGTGSPPHLAGELFKLRANVDILHVPYKGGPLALTDLMGGRLTMYFSNALTALRLLKNQQVKALAVTSLTRMTIVPDIPTMAESALPGFEEYIWYVVAVPSRTPAARVRALNSDIVATLRSAEVASVLTADGAEIVAGTPEACASYTRSEIAKYAEVIAKAGLRGSP